MKSVAQTQSMPLPKSQKLDALLTHVTLKRVAVTAGACVALYVGLMLVVAFDVLGNDAEFQNHARTVASQSASDSILKFVFAK